MAPLNSYAPSGLAGIVLSNSGKTIGPSLSVTKAQTFPATGGTLPITGAGQYPIFGATGKFADAGEVADCLNQLAARIEALENILAANPAYGITET